MRTQDMPIVLLSGGPEERGRRHGEMFKDAIARIIDTQARQLAGPGEDDYLRAAHREKSEFLEQCHFEAAIEEWAPEVLAEITGIAEGAGVDRDEILFLNFGDEQWCYAAAREASANGGTCTSFGVAGQSEVPTLSGQNMDIGLWLEGFQTLFRIKHETEDAYALVLSHPGYIGLCGVNTAPIGIACNALMTLKARNEGLPVSFIVRKFLSCLDFDEAVSFLKTAPHATGQNYLISSSREVRSFEASAGRVEEYRPDADGRRVFHSNHPLVNGDLSKVVRQPYALASTHARLASIAGRLGRQTSRIEVEDVKAALSAHDDPACPVSRLGDDRDSLIGYTFGSVIYELTDKPKMHVAAGPPCRTDWIEVGINPDTPY
ncbi:MAG: C45 family peptidase [Pseudomonadota bacterium]